VSIEYCTGCKWNLRAFWMAQELLGTFEPDGRLRAVTLIPSSEAGRFLVQCDDGTAATGGADAAGRIVLWDRKERGRFPEMKELKQLVRDRIDPDKFLGHSDCKQDEDPESPVAASTGIVVEDEGGAQPPAGFAPVFAVSPHVAIQYCTGCQWTLRAAYLAQELCKTFASSSSPSSGGTKIIRSVALLPSPAPDGRFVVWLDDAVLWDRTRRRRFPEPRELKQLVRDRLAPDLDLGHVDGGDDDDAAATGSDVAANTDQPSVPDIMMDEDDGEEARKFFGVA
jgi:selenoprotein W-related protein